ncbi:uncharacterized protein KY384_001878 [Bacidia gigantensis]|uniref:uncharacterized protein n=1 Tax=Bacidia gigantensis TaxID=2732470 RepID=UPI001D04AFA5|nr:uncharacterized protein KY384_001878 [Bacidia gigantensis]KAG8533095.1 hypothetical protein KY384_001878 [Bacidia gigantensis]
MAAPVYVTKASELDDSTGQTQGMIRKGAIVDRGQICASVMIAKPHSASAIHTHGDQDTIVYSLRGNGSIVSEGGTKREDLKPGDFALIPAHAEHQEVNDSLAILGLCTPVPPAATYESGNGIAPWAGSGPKPKSSAPQVAYKLQAVAGSSAVPVGAVISGCTQPGTVALTFDDGPYIYTAQVLDTLKAAKIHATFFVNGDNWANILSNDSKALVNRELAEGHQIGSHTWDHKDLTTLDTAAITSEMTDLEDALISIIGKYPAYMRPPYLSTNDSVLQTLGGLGYHVISANIDTKDYENDSEAAIQTAVQNFKTGLDQGGSIELSHDVHQWTAKTLVSAMIQEVQNRGLQAVTVGECLGDPVENWYRTR